eukprot:scaffold6293_cov120-Cylindrotheca_fusiformis.AAC.2
MPDANMSEPVPAAHVVTPQRNGGHTVAPTPAPVPLVNATAVEQTPLAAVRTRQELIIKRGIYKGKWGYLDESRGHGGYSTPQHEKASTSPILMKMVWKN